ncbi:MAG: RHS repeat domain-containing protein, partial [Capsulimonadaceae bacterium]
MQITTTKKTTGLGLTARAISFAMACAFVWTFCLAPAAAAAAPAVKQTVERIAADRLARHQAAIRAARVQAAMEQVARANWARYMREVPRLSPRPLSVQLPPPVSLLDDVGHLARPGGPAQIAAWTAEVNTPRIDRNRAAQLRIWLGEVKLAVDDRAPDAIAQFQAAQSLATTPAGKGLAAYDIAVAQFRADSFALALRSFTALLAPTAPHAGYDSRRVALWLAHARACAAYHEHLQAMGVPQSATDQVLYCYIGLISTGPGTDDVVIKGLDAPAGAGRTWINDAHTDADTLHRARVALGNGNTFQKIADAASVLGKTTRCVAADDMGVQGLPKPLVAHVENDHFVIISAADDTGVYYNCPLCARGILHVNWKQWHAMLPTQYLCFANRGSADDRMLSELVDRNPARSLPVSAPPSRFQGVSLRRAASLGVKYSGHYGSLPFREEGPGVGSERPIRQRVGATSLSAAAFHRACATHGGRARMIRDHVVRMFILWGEFIRCGMKMDGQHCCPCNGCPSAGKHVNLATGEEEYDQGPDLVVYNPKGPPVVWERYYNSLQSPGQQYAYGDPWDQCADFGVGWSQSYNVGVYDPSPGQAGTKYIYNANQSRVSFITPSAPAGGAGAVCAVEPGEPMQVNWVSDNTLSGHFVITFPNREQWTTNPAGALSGCGTVSKITDRNGNSIQFNYTNPNGSYTGDPLISSITTSGGTTLLKITRAMDGSGAIQNVTDCYGRTIYYHVGAYPTYNVAAGCPQDYFELDRVSQINSSSDLDVYGYTIYPNTVDNSNGAEGVLFLTSMSTPSPTGGGISTTTLTYDANVDVVTSETDADGNKMLLSSSDALGNPVVTSKGMQATSNYTGVAILGPSYAAAYEYVVGYNSNMSQTSITDGAGNVIENAVYDDPNDPIRPSTVTDGNGNVSSFSWDQFGNNLTATSPRGTKVTNQYNYTGLYTIGGTPFTLGELTSSTVTSSSGPAQTPTSYTYYEPSGLVDTISYAQPGTTGGPTVTATYAWDTVGNLTSVVGPGNNSGLTESVTLGYGASGDAIGEPSTITDSLGHTTSFTYDSQGNVRTVTDALGNVSTAAYDVANEPTSVILPATGEQGSGQSSIQINYQYPEGPVQNTQLFDETGAAIRTVNYHYGPEGEMLSVGGNTEPATYSYDPIFRVTSVTDGGGNVTRYGYNKQGYLASVVYPMGDSVQYPSYDKDGNVLQRTAGRNQGTSYYYNDPESLLTEIAYASNPSENVYYAYDGFGRVSGMSDGTAGTPTTPGVTFAYDDLDEPTSVATTYTGLPTATIGYNYYPDGST